MPDMVIKHLGHVDGTEKLTTFYLPFAGLIPWTLHFFVLVVWTER
jgi:hypothetical protein